MQYVNYGQNGPEVSRLGFGVMRLPARKAGGWGQPNLVRGRQLIREAMQGGVNFLDSHHFYHEGLSEAAIGKALRGWKGPRPVIQTKTPYYRKDQPQKWFQGLIEQALEKLGVQKIDYLLFHSMSGEMFDTRAKGFFRLSDWAIRRGYVKYRGFSTHAPPQEVRRFIDTGEFSAMLVSYNWMNPVMAETIAHAAQRGMGVSVMNPVGGGLLASETPPIRRLLPSAKSPAALALRYVLDTPGVAVALSGMNSSEQIRENLAVASRERMFTARQRETLGKRLEAIRRRGMAACTACGYCMPCPHGVDIPQNFLLLNRAKLLELRDHAEAVYRRLAAHPRGDRSAGACRACGQCLDACPNDVPIVRQLRETRELLGGK